MAADCTHPSGPRPSVLYLAFELGVNERKLAFSVSLGTACRLRTVGAGNPEKLRREISLAKKKFRIEQNGSVVSCYEAARPLEWDLGWIC